MRGVWLIESNDCNRWEVDGRFAPTESRADALAQLRDWKRARRLRLEGDLARTSYRVRRYIPAPAKKVKKGT